MLASNAPTRVAFRGVNNVGTRIHNAFAAQWLADTLPYRRFARIGGDVGCYSFIAADFPHISLPVSRRTHSRYGLSDCSTAHGGLCHEASVQPLPDQTARQLPEPTDNSLGGSLLHS